MPGLTLLLLAGSISFGGPRREPGADRWLGRDKVYHFAVSTVIHATSHTILANNGSHFRRAAWSAAGITLAIGAGKEWWDSRGHGDPSWKDFAADAAGTGTGAVLMRQVSP